MGMHLWTACTVVNRRGEFLTRLVKTNSNLELNLASTHRAWVGPRSLDLALRILRVAIQLRPMLRFILVLVCDIHLILKLVMIRAPLSPLFPLVSSTELMESMTFSPGLSFS